MAIDTHAHLEMEAFDSDREEVLERATAAGLTAIITVGTTLPDAEKAVALTRRYPLVYAAVGIHPHEVKGIDAAVYDALRLLAREKKVVAIGEIGLDFFYDNSPRDVQLRCFAEQLDLAEELDLPVISTTGTPIRRRSGSSGSGRGVCGGFSTVSRGMRQWPGSALSSGSISPWRGPSPTRRRISSGRSRGRSPQSGS